MQEAVRIVIIVEGGLVQDVLSAGVPVEYVLVDYDTSGADEADTVSVPQSDGTNATAFVSWANPASIDGPFAQLAFNLSRERPE